MYIHAFVHHSPDCSLFHTHTHTHTHSVSWFFEHVLSGDLDCGRKEEEGARMLQEVPV